MPRLCDICRTDRAVLKRPKTLQSICRPCFYYVFETEIHHTITSSRLFQPGDRVAIGASGGKDSTVLAHVLKTLNERHRYGLELFLLSIDEGITGYRDDSLETVKRNQQQYDLPLKIVSYEELYRWSMDAIVKEVGLKNNCTFCGVFRRQALDRGAQMLRVDHIVTGHNADDIAETVLMNLLRGDVARLQRCTEIATTGEDGATGPEDRIVPRSKPFKYTYEKEIVMYAYFKKLDYFSTECIYSPNAYRGYARTFLKDLEAIRPSAIIDIIHAGEAFQVRHGVKMPTQGTCERCGYIASNRLCKACVLLEGLNRGLPRLGISRTGQHRTAEDIPAAKTVTVTVGDSSEVVRGGTNVADW
ncbi:cytosolic thiouridylase subunit Ctu1 [Tieghemiomyces parasiticus]|uniref:Cytoplasmic tRNA 2-thiolation protein 1 n=1 Tax=Tieghemiomyces parasiticus TaxID=78921 RepID=A0A9W7ZQN9_9FUNG|nr:cytosolic thiouridylase subunit Ctu1 [Tieghemiomyces parasiticus]